MQLYGMASEPVRASLEITWWPVDDGFSTSSRLWIREDGSGTWAMQAMEASPIQARHEIREHVKGWANDWASYLTLLADEDRRLRIRP